MFLHFIVYYIFTYPLIHSNICIFRTYISVSHNSLSSVFQLSHVVRFKSIKSWVNWLSYLQAMLFTWEFIIFSKTIFWGNGRRNELYFHTFEKHMKWAICTSHAIHFTCVVWVNFLFIFDVTMFGRIILPNISNKSHIVLWYYYSTKI